MSVWIKFFFSFTFCFYLFSIPVNAQTTLAFSAHDWFHQGIEHTKNNNYAEAQIDFTEAINLQPNWAGAYSNLCLVDLQLNNSQAAVDDCANAIKLNPDNWEAYLNQGLAHYRLGNYSASIASYQKIIQHHQHDYRAYYNTLLSAKSGMRK